MSTPDHGKFISYESALQAATTFGDCYQVSPAHAIQFQPDEEWYRTLRDDRATQDPRYIAHNEAFLARTRFIHTVGRIFTTYQFNHSSSTVADYVTDTLHESDTVLNIDADDLGYGQVTLLAQDNLSWKAMVEIWPEMADAQPDMKTYELGIVRDMPDEAFPDRVFFAPATYLRPVALLDSMHQNHHDYVYSADRYGAVGAVIRTKALAAENILEHHLGRGLQKANRSMIPAAQLLIRACDVLEVNQATEPIERLAIDYLRDYCQAASAQD